MKKAGLCTQGNGSSIIEKVCCGRKRLHTASTKK